MKGAGAAVGVLLVTHGKLGHFLLDTMARTDPRAAHADPGAMVDDSFVRNLDESGYVAALYA